MSLAFSPLLTVPSLPNSPLLSLYIYFPLSYSKIINLLTPLPSLNNRYLESTKMCLHIEILISEESLVGGILSHEIKWKLCVGAGGVYVYMWQKDSRCSQASPA